jgi:hypothetical protein
VKNTVGNSDEPDSLRHHSVISWRSEKTVENPRHFTGLPSFIAPYGIRLTRSRIVATCE